MASPQMEQHVGACDIGGTLLGPYYEAILPFGYLIIRRSDYLEVYLRGTLL